MKEQKRRKGIIDSDEDDNDKTRNAEVISEDDDNTEVSSSSADVDNFIVPDNGDIDEEELARAARMMPGKPTATRSHRHLLCLLYCPLSSPFGTCCAHLGGPFPRFCELF